MDIMAEVQSQIKSTGGVSCTLMLFLKKINRADAAEFRRIIYKTTVPAAAIHRALVKRGLTGSNRIDHHRRGGCISCRSSNDGQA